MPCAPMRDPLPPSPALSYVLGSPDLADRGVGLPSPTTAPRPQWSECPFHLKWARYRWLLRSSAAAVPAYCHTTPAVSSHGREVGFHPTPGRYRRIARVEARSPLMGSAIGDKPIRCPCRCTRGRPMPHCARSQQSKFPEHACTTCSPNHAGLVLAQPSYG